MFGDWDRLKLEFEDLGSKANCYLGSFGCISSSMLKCVVGHSLLTKDPLPLLICASV